MKLIFELKELETLQEPCQTKGIYLSWKIEDKAARLLMMTSVHKYFIVHLPSVFIFPSLGPVLHLHILSLIFLPLKLIWIVLAATSVHLTFLFYLSLKEPAA